MICKHYGTPQGCSYGDKCQFAHGQKELRTNNMQGFPAIQMANAGKAQNNIINYKIVKCKNFEKDGTCKYGQHCTFAHGDKDLRNKSENMFQASNQMMIMPFPYAPMEGLPFMINPQNLDGSQVAPIPAMMGQSQPYIMMNPMAPVNSGGINNDNGEQKAENTQQ